MTVKDDKAWEASWIPYVLPLINSKHLMRKTTLLEDRTQCMDLCVGVPGDISIGLRMRYPEYFDRYKNEITFRAKRDSGTVTEWSKIVDEEMGDLMFYGFANPGWKHFRCVRRWTLISLHAVRRIMAKHSPTLKMIRNPDNATYFYPVNVLQWAKLDAKFVMDANWNRSGFGLDRKE